MVHPDVSENAATVVLFVAVALAASKANDAVLFYKAAFGTKEVGHTLNPKRKAARAFLLLISLRNLLHP
ncbi:hypothetical protein E2542_SST31163 [Spatholobus suberectus]|nr:hypothetical protein E2542_SST31163 [Spatholobus suberectus]